MLNNLLESHVGSNRDAIKADLLGKVVYDDPAVFKRLRVDLTLLFAESRVNSGEHSVSKVWPC